MTDWYYADAANIRRGPLTPEALRDLHRRGEVTTETLVWCEGMQTWAPLRECLHRLSPEAPPTVPGDDLMDAAPRADATPYLEVTAGADAAPADNPSPYAPPTATLDRPAGVVPGGEVVDAGFLRRAAALCIDNVLVTVVYYALMIVFLLLGGMGSLLGGGMESSPFGPTFAILMGLGYLSWPLVSGLYYVLMESSAQQATLGKMAVGIKVTALDGARISRSHALGRWASHLLNYLTLYIGYLLPLFTRRKQGLHDLVARTYVVDRWAYTAMAERQQRGLGTVATVVLVIVGVGLLGLVGVVMLTGLTSAFM